MKRKEEKILSRVEPELKMLVTLASFISMTMVGLWPEANTQVNAQETNFSLPMEPEECSIDEPSIIALPEPIKLAEKDSAQFWRFYTVQGIDGSTK